MTAPFVWFDLTADDAEVAREFYAGLFGWPIGGALVALFTPATA